MNTNTQCIDAINNGGNVPSKIIDFKISYKSTDGWRGYYIATPTKKSGWIKENEDGWVTGNWDDAGENASDNVETKLEKMEKMLIDKKREMIVVFLPTSNVFSTAYEVFSRPII